MEKKNSPQKPGKPRSRRVKGGSTSASVSSDSTGDQTSKCGGDQALEFACSACVCCVSCPISMVWCCIKLPCKIGWRAVQNAADWACSCGSGKQVCEEYSSFSDIDSDSLPLPRRTNSSGRLIGCRSRTICTACRCSTRKP